MTPGIDKDIGITVYATSFAGCGGTIKGAVGDFAVSEVLSDASLAAIGAESGYAVYVMRKAGVDTPHALQRMRRATGIKLKALGLKDARATTEQYVCATSRSARLAEYADGEVSLSPVGYAPRPLSARDMVGNSFAIEVRGHDGTLGEFSEWDDVPNFYAYQRFGSAHTVTHVIGRAMVAGDWKRAAEAILHFESPHGVGKDAERRRRIAECSTYDEMICEMPRGMDIERGVASSLARGGDELGAIRTIPVGIRRLYVQAYQSYIFNRALSEAIGRGEGLTAQDGDVCYGKDGRLGRCGAVDGPALALPLMGHSYYAKTRFADIVAEIMREEGTSPRDFAVPDMREAAAEGGFRTAMMLPREASADGGTVRLTLRRGSYATALMREVIKPQDPVAAGLAA